MTYNLWSASSPPNIHDRGVAILPANKAACGKLRVCVGSAGGVSERV